MSKMDFAAMRAAMVDSQLRTSDVSDPAVIAAMAHVERETFVPADKAASAYIDRAIALGGGRMLNPPLATGRLLTAAAIQPGDKVLLIGAAGGYTAAVLAAMGANVVAVEVDAALASAAKLPETVTTVSGALAAGAPKMGPYDVLFIDGAVEELPKALTDQLVDNGRIVTGILERGVTRAKAGAKVGSSIGMTSLYDMEMAVLPGFAKAATFSF